MLEVIPDITDNVDSFSTAVKDESPPPCPVEVGNNTVSSITNSEKLSTLDMSSDISGSDDVNEVELVILCLGEEAEIG